jgi:hypothetical protein
MSILISDPTKKQEKISKKLPSHERCLKDKNHPYIKLNTDFVCVTTMSGLAKAILLYAMTRPKA